MLHLVVDIEQFIEGIKEHLGPIALMQNVLVLQGAVLHGGHLEAHNAIRPAFPLLLCEEKFLPILCLNIASNLQVTTSKHNTGIRVSHDPQM